MFPFAVLGIKSGALCMLGELSLSSIPRKEILDQMLSKWLVHNPKRMAA